MNGGIGRGKHSFPQLNKEDAQKELLSHPPGDMPSVVLEWLVFRCGITALRHLWNLLLGFQTLPFDY
jgi:hypothetical protein